MYLKPVAVPQPRAQRSNHRVLQVTPPKLVLEQRELLSWHLVANCSPPPLDGSTASAFNYCAAGWVDTLLLSTEQEGSAPTPHSGVLPGIFPAVSIQQGILFPCKKKFKSNVEVAIHVLPSASASCPVYSPAVCAVSGWCRMLELTT